VLLVLVAAVWFAGPYIGLARVDFRIFAVLALVVLWVIFALVLAKSQSSSSAQITASVPTSSLSVQPPQVSLPSVPSGVQVQMASPGAMTASGQAGETNLLRSQLERAIQWLRSSKIRKSQGVDVVYQLPWYVLIGSAAAGKSMGLAQSDLDFPYTDPDRSMGKRGVEPTQGCDIWIANEALFLDTAGRYSTEKEKDGWLGLLDQIKRYRKDKPLDGVILGVDLAQVLKAGEDDLKEQARRFRSRLDEMTQKFGMALPVYLVFNKSDLVQGFREFFSDLSEEERTQVWGCTLRREQYQGLQPHQEFEKEFQQLCDSLTARRLSRLTSKSSIEGKDKIYSFPVQMALAKNQLIEFVTWLFQPNTFRERPIFRGFYFTSSVQQGLGVDPVLDYMNRKAGFLEPASGSGETRDSNSYFLKNLFTQVIFPDRVLSGSSSTRQRRGLLVRIALFLALGVLLPLLLFFAIRAYNNNERFLAAIDKAAKTEPKGNKSPLDLEILKDLRIHLERFDSHFNSGSAGGFQWGMYIGDQVLDPARKIYALRLKQVLVNPAAQDLKIDLRNLAVSPGMDTPKVTSITGMNYYLLMTYLMMSEPRRAEEEFLGVKACPLPKAWNQGVQADFSAEAEKQLAFYWHVLSVHQDSNFLVSKTLEDDQLVASKREFLLTFPVVENYYSRLKREGDAKVATMTLSRAMDGKDLDLFSGGAEIPGFLTRNGWEASAKDGIPEKSAEYERNSWVLGRPALGIDATKPGKEAMQAKLSEMYFGDYNRQWWNFLIAAKLNSSSNRKEAIERLARLSRSQDSPIFRLLKSVSSNSFEELNDKPIDNPYQGTLVRSFQSIHRFMNASAGQKLPVSQYLEVLAKVYQELYTYYSAGEPADQTARMRQVILDALSQTASITQNFDPESQRVVKPLLEQPIRMAWGLAPAGDSQSPVTAPTLGPLTPPDASKGTGGSGLVVSGLVASLSGTPLDKATVYILKPGVRQITFDNYITVVTTDSEGRFRFPKAVPPGSYSISAKARGYQQKFGDITLSPGKSGLKIVLSPE
jgi:type VI secretion system protein ImpL